MQRNNLNRESGFFVSFFLFLIKRRFVSSIENQKNEGFDVILGNHSLNNHFQFSGTDQERFIDLQEALDDEKCKAIICSRGGYGSIRIADKLDLSSFKKHPKWLIGFSDITVLHCLFQKHEIASIHGAMPGFYLKDGSPTNSFSSLVQMLKGESQFFKIEAHPLNKAGETSAELIGGNLSILYSLLGTPFEPETKGKILFIEDLSEYLYHLDRIMHSLKLSGKLRNLSGMIVGSFTDMKDNDSPFGKTVEEIIIDAVKEYNFPVCFNFPAGHTEQNLPLILGAEYELKINGRVIIKEKKA